MSEIKVINTVEQNLRDSKVIRNRKSKAKTKHQQPKMTSDKVVSYNFVFWNFYPFLHFSKKQ